MQGMLDERDPLRLMISGPNYDDLSDRYVTYEQTRNLIGRDQREIKGAR